MNLNSLSQSESDITIEFPFSAMNNHEINWMHDEYNEGVSMSCNNHMILIKFMPLLIRDPWSGFSIYPFQ